MKLGQLNSAIRGLKGAPKCKLSFTDGNGVHSEFYIQLDDLEITKQSLLAALAKRFPEASRSVETHLFIDDRGHLCRADGGGIPLVDVDEAEEQPAPASALDDLLG